MIQRYKKMTVALFLGGIMITSGVLIAVPGIAPKGQEIPDDPMLAPAYYFAEEDRLLFCGSMTGFSPALSTDYVTEYQIPTACTLPLAITTDSSGDVWFAQSNTGNVAKFDAVTGQFTEYENPWWDAGRQSTMRGADYSPDGTVWVTDDNSIIWRFHTETNTYDPVPYPAETRLNEQGQTVPTSTPQKISADDSQVIINDVTGNKLTFMDPADPDNAYHVRIPAQAGGAVTAGFAVDSEDAVWFTAWADLAGGSLVRFDNQAYLEQDADAQAEPLDFVTLYELPGQMRTPNDLAVDSAGNVWLVDTSNSFFYSFDPMTEQFVGYVTADPLQSTYGNYTGVIKNPVSRPYWIQSDDAGRLVMNAQLSNNIAVMDPSSQTLIEYHVPSKNPYWSDCARNQVAVDGCGIAQILDMDVHGSRVWFTEMVMNNIGVVDTSIPLPISISLDSQGIQIAPGQSRQVDVEISSLGGEMSAEIVLSSFDESITVSDDLERESLGPIAGGFVGPDQTSIQIAPGDAVRFAADISVSEQTPSGTYKVLLGAQLPDVMVGKFVTVTVA